MCLSATQPVVRMRLQLINCLSSVWKWRRRLTGGGGVADGAVLLQSRILGEQQLIGAPQLLQSVRHVSQLVPLQSRLRLRHQGEPDHCNVKEREKKSTYTTPHRAFPRIQGSRKNRAERQEESSSSQSSL